MGSKRGVNKRFNPGILQAMNAAREARKENEQARREVRALSGVGKVREVKGKLIAECPRCYKPNVLDSYAAAQLGCGHELTGACEHCKGDMKINRNRTAPIGARGPVPEVRP